MYIKWTLQNTYEDLRFVINKVNMHHLNIIINYFF